MILGLGLFFWFFISFTMKWHWEPPHSSHFLSQYQLDENNSTLCTKWMFNQTWFYLFSIRTHCSEELEYIIKNVEKKCPDVDQLEDKYRSACSYRKVLIFAAVGFVIIKTLGLFFYIYKKHLCFQSGVQKPIEFGLWVRFPLLTKFNNPKKGGKTLEPSVLGHYRKPEALSLRMPYTE